MPLGASRRFASFAAALLLAGCGKYTISGNVSGAIADGVVLVLSGDTYATTTTAGGGLYSIPGIANGHYTLTPSSPGYTFSPVSIAVKVSGGDVADRDFTAIALGGTLDASFGSGGKVTTAFGTTSTSGAGGVAIQTDGRIVAAGSIGDSGTQSFALARYDENGNLDSGFGSGGKVTTAFGTGNDGANAVAIQADGKIVAAGFAFSGDTTTGGFALARYRTDGSLDAGFGTGGQVTTAFGTGGGDEAIAIQMDGKIVAAGASNGTMVLARYDTDGSLDNGFGRGGTVTTAFGIGSATALGVGVQADGRIVAAGSAYDRTRGFFALARYQADGTLDATFGTGGTVTTAISDWDEARAVGMQPDGKIVAAGCSSTLPPYPQHVSNSNAFALVRYQVDGTLDATFGNGGKVTTAFDTGENDVAYALAIQADGKIVAAGRTDGASGSRFALSRYETDGSLDPSFGTGGKVTTRLSTSDLYDDSAWSLAIQADGKFVAAGNSGGGFGLARYWP